MVEVYVNMASAQPRVHDEPDNKSQRTPHSAQGEPNDELVEYLKDRFPKRFIVLRYVAGNINCYGTAYKRLLHYKLINGTLRDLGMGTDRNERFSLYAEIVRSFSTASEPHLSESVTYRLQWQENR